MSRNKRYRLTIFLRQSNDNWMQSRSRLSFELPMHRSTYLTWKVFRIVKCYMSPILCSHPKINSENTNSLRLTSLTIVLESSNGQSVMRMLTCCITKFTASSYSRILLQFYACLNFAEEIYWFFEAMKPVGGTVFCSRFSHFWS